MSFFYSLLKAKKVPKKEPNIKLEPTMKLIGSSMVSFINKFILLLFELFWIPINKKINKQELKTDEKNNFLMKKLILVNTLSCILNHIVNFAFL